MIFNRIFSYLLHLFLIYPGGSRELQLTPARSARVSRHENRETNEEMLTQKLEEHSIKARKPVNWASNLSSQYGSNTHPTNNTSKKPLWIKPTCHQLKLWLLPSVGLWTFLNAWIQVKNFWTTVYYITMYILILYKYIDNIDKCLRQRALRAVRLWSSQKQLFLMCFYPFYSPVLMRKWVHTNTDNCLLISFSSESLLSVALIKNSDRVQLAAERWKSKHGKFYGSAKNWEALLIGLFSKLIETHYVDEGSLRYHRNHDRGLWKGFSMTAGSNKEISEVGT